MASDIPMQPALQGNGQANDESVLCYPSIAANHVVAEAASSTILSATAMDHDVNSEDTLSSLSDSTYDIISRSSYRTSDDDDNDSHMDGADSVASFDIATPEEGSVVDDTDERHAEDPDRAGLNLPAIVRERDFQRQRLSTSSIQTSVINHSDLSSDTVTQKGDSWISFREPMAGIADGLVDVTRQTGNTNSRQNFPSDSITNAKRVLQVRGSFRVVYYGDKAYKDLTVEKIAEAVAVSVTPDGEADRNTSSRLSVVTVSDFGSAERGSRNVMLIPSTGLEIHVDDCTGFSLASRRSFLDPSSIRFRWAGSSKSCTVPKPDLAVFVHCTTLPGAESMIETALARAEILCRLRIPTIHICDGKPPAILRAYLPFCLCDGLDHHEVASSTNDWTGTTAIATAPVEIGQFLDTDPAVLNETIADLTTHSADQYAGSKDSWLNYLFLILSKTAELLSLYASVYCTIWTGIIRAFRTVNVNHYRSKMSQVGKVVAIHKRDLFVSLLFTFCCVLPWLLPTSSFQTPRLSSKGLITPQDDKRDPAKLVPSTLPPHSAVMSIASVTQTPRPIIPPAPSKKTGALATVNSVTGLSTLPPIRQSPSKELSKGPEFQVLESAEGRLFLQASKNPPRKWQPSSRFVHATHVDKPCKASVSRINRTTFDLHLDESCGCGPILLTVWPLEGRDASQTFELKRPCDSFWFAETPLFPFGVMVQYVNRYRPSVEAQYENWMSLYQQRVASLRAGSRRLEQAYGEWAPTFEEWGQIQASLVKAGTGELNKARSNVKEHAGKLMQSMRENTHTVVQEVKTGLDVAKDSLARRFKNANCGLLCRQERLFQTIYNHSSASSAARSYIKRAKFRAKAMMGGASRTKRSLSGWMRNFRSRVRHRRQSQKLTKSSCFSAFRGHEERKYNWEKGDSRADAKKSCCGKRKTGRKKHHR